MVDSEEVLIVKSFYLFDTYSINLILIERNLYK